MVVRDEHGNILNPDVTSAIELYWHHEKATERIKKETVSQFLFFMHNFILNRKWKKCPSTFCNGETSGFETENLL